MVSYRRLQATLEGTLSGSIPSPQQRTELFHLLHICRPDFESFLVYPDPKPSDRTQVLSKEVRLPDAPPTILDDQDIQIALKLSDDFHLNEIDCVSLLVAAHQEWNLLGRDPLEILRLSAGLWFTERRALINCLLLILRAVVLDEELDPDLVSNLRQYVESLIDGDVRKRLIVLIKELNREQPSGLGGPGVEPYVVDSRGAVVQRRDIAQRERLSLSQCLAFSCLVVRIKPNEAKEIYGLLKDCSAEIIAIEDTVKLQITYTIMFTIVIFILSDALAGSGEMGSVLSTDQTFRREFHIQVTETGPITATKGFTELVRLVWAIFLMLNNGNVSDARVCLDHCCEHDVFKFITSTVLKTAAYQNDDEDLVFMYNAYLHKLLTIFLSSSIGREKIKVLKDAAMMAFDSYSSQDRNVPMDDDVQAQRQAIETQASPFISLLEFVSEIYKREPELVAENDILWNFVRFVGEDHTSFLTLVAFLNMLKDLASSEEGARKVYNLLENKTFRTVGWQTLFNSLNVYEEHFRQCLQTTGALLPPMQEGDAKALDSYLCVLKKVMEAGNEVEKTMWFPEYEPLFKLLPYQNVPPYLKGALRNAIAAFVPLSPIVRDKVWSLLEAYDLPVSAGSSSSVQQVYDMTFELNEIEARQEEYPSTISYLNLLNVLVANETDTSDKGQRYAGIFRFARDQVLAPYAQRAYADPGEKWQMVVAVLRHFQMMLTMYQVNEEILENSMDQRRVEGNLPTIELMKDLMSGKVIFRSIMSVLMLGVNFVLEERANKIYGASLEEAVQLCLDLIVLALSKDTLYADYWRPVCQSLDVILSHDSRQITTILEYIHYDSSTAIQQSSVKIMDILSSRIPHLVSIIIDSGVASNLIEDYAVALETRSQESQRPDGSEEDIGSLIIRMLLSNINRPAPNVTHLLLKFDLDQPIERTILQPKRYYSCLRVILDLVESYARPDVNASLHELGLQLIYELCVDELTSGPMLELMRSEKYDFFAGHLSIFACDPIPGRDQNQSLRISDLQQRAWLLKLLALELHVSDMDVMTHRRSCRRLVGQLFLHENIDGESVSNGNQMPLLLTNSPSDSLHKIKILELLDIILFPLPEPHNEFPPSLDPYKEELKVEEILGNSALVDANGVYTISERGDRLIDLPAFRDKLWQEYKRLEVQYNLLMNERRQASLREAIQQLLRWAWKRNKFLEEQAAQLHMLVAWSQLVEVTISRRFEFLGNCLQVLFDILDATLDASISPDCSVRMSFAMSQVILTAMAKLQDQSFSSPGEGESSDDVTYVDLLSSVRISNSACQTILSKLLTSILRADSSEPLRRRQYATLLTYFHYCKGMVNSDLSLSVMVENQDGEEDGEIEKLDKEQAELAQVNFGLLKQEATGLVELVARDATHGSEVGKAVAFYVLETLLALDRNQIFFGQLQSRGLLHGCFADISTNSYQALVLPSRDMIRRLYTIEAELAMLLRLCYHNKKRGAQALFAMGAIQHLSACKAIDVQLMEGSKNEHALKSGLSLPSQHDKQRQIVIPILRLVLCFTTLIDTTGGKGRDEVALEILEFIKLHHGLFDRILRDDGSGVELGDLEERELVTAILSKVWPLEDSEEFGFKQALFNLAYVYFVTDAHSRSRFVQHVRNSSQNSELSNEDVRKLRIAIFRLRANLACYLHTLVSKKGMRLHLSRPDDATLPMGTYTLGRQRQPTLKLVSTLLEQAAADLDSAVDEKSLIVTKLHDINELSRHEVDEIIKLYGRYEATDSTLKPAAELESMRKRRYLAMVEMCSAVSARDSEIAALLLIVEHALEILYLHQDNIFSAAAAAAADGTESEERKEVEALSHRLLPTFEKLEGLKEDKVGHSVKHMQRLVYSLKSRTLRMK